MAGRLWAPSGGRYSWRFLTCFRPATSLRKEVADLNQLHEVIMTTQSKVTSPRRKPKSQTIYPLSRYEIEHRTRVRALRELNEFIGSLTESEKRVVGHVTPYGDPVNGIKEIRRLLGESIAKCKVIPFPVRNSQSKSVLEA